MTSLPARHQLHASSARYENNVGDGAIHIVVQEPFNVRDNALTLLITAFCIGFIYCVTMVF